MPLESADLMSFEAEIQNLSQNLSSQGKFLKEIDIFILIRYYIWIYRSGDSLVREIWLRFQRTLIYVVQIFLCWRHLKLNPICTSPIFTPAYRHTYIWYVYRSYTNLIELNDKEAANEEAIEVPQKEVCILTFVLTDIIMRQFNCYNFRLNGFYESISVGKFTILVNI